ncbi:hypothetical protein [Sphingomonas sp. SORGH_AS_0879]|uniref:hypothetical protein n=1 Tax=Sphingomonas sp. SORGH_AS_0879 TaxID=3041790 RepID=UPI002788BCC2|nr:hypothetical protein [Sphingomonas sp. SORGH_AS_0879]MDQ1229488.1 hypothetical protein [Sphingomonas sp. SORGH_AS_0879]
MSLEHGVSLAVLEAVSPLIRIMMWVNPRGIPAASLHKPDHFCVFMQNNIVGVLSET